MHLTTLFWVFVFTSKIFAAPVTSYYISLSGSDNNNGSKSNPFRTIEKLNSIKLESNTFIYLQGGAVFAGPLILKPGENVQEHKLITITSYGNGMATINGNLKEAVIISKSYFSIRNIKAIGAGRKQGNTANGIYISGSGFALIENVVTEGFQKAGIELNNCHNIELKNVNAKNNGFSGIYVSGIKSSSKNITITSCTADNNAGDLTNLTNHSGNGILVSGSDSVLIDHCTATNNGWDMPRTGNGPVGIWAYESDHLTIQYCISYKNKTHTGASDGGGFDFDGGMTNSIIQYCLSYENQGSGYGLYQYNGAGLWSNNTVRYCVSIDDGQVTKGAAGFLIWNETADSSKFGNCYIYNNTVYNNVSPVVRFDNNSANRNFIFANNIFLGTSDIISGPLSGDVYKGNIWWHSNENNITFRGYKSLEEWTLKSGQRTTPGTFINPLLNGPFITAITDPFKLNLLSGFKLQPGSPIKNMGIDVTSLDSTVFPTTDFFGNVISKNSTVPGIYQLQE